PRLAQQEYGSAGDHFAAMANKGLKELLEIQGARLIIDEGDNIDAKNALQLGLGVEIVEHHIADFAPLQLYDHAKAVFVGLVAQLGNTFQFLFFDQLGDALN